MNQRDSQAARDAEAGSVLTLEELDEKISSVDAFMMVLNEKLDRVLSRTFLILVIASAILGSIIVIRL